MAKRSNGEGTVRYNPARARWEGRITIGVDTAGRLRRRMVTGQTKSAVLKLMREARDADNAGASPLRRDHTVGRFLDEWVADVLPGAVAQTTAQQYSDIVRLYLRPELGRKQLATLSARDVSAMLRRLGDRGLSPNTRRLARAVLRRALRYAEQEGYVMRNVAAIAPGVKLAAGEGRTMTPAQARIFLASIAGHPLEPAFLVALSAGVRVGELLALGWDLVDVDGPTPRITIRRGLKRLKGQGLIIDDVKTPRSRRTVHLPPATAAALRIHRARQREQRLALGPDWPSSPLGVDLVFRTPIGTPIDPSNFWAALSSATRHAGAEYESGPDGKPQIVEGTGLGHWHPHELRHSAASLLLAQGVPLKVVSEILGHSSIAITADIYAHLLDDAREAAASAMGAALWGETTG